MVLITIVTGAYKPTYNWGGTLHEKGGISLSRDMKEDKRVFQWLANGWCFALALLRGVQKLHYR